MPGEVKLKLLNRDPSPQWLRVGTCLCTLFSVVIYFSMVGGSAFAQGPERKVAPALSEAGTPPGEDVDDQLDRERRLRISAKPKKAKKLPISGTLEISTAIGLGSFYGDTRRQTAVSIGFIPALRYKVSKVISVSGSMAGTLYAKNGYGSAISNGTFWVSDLHFTLSHGKLYENKNLGLTLSGAFRVYFPTSLSSRFQNRIMTMRPSLSARFKFGSVSISFLSMFAKYFSSSTVPSVNCGDFTEGACIDGRPSGPGVGGGFESERNGGEVFLPGYGTSSFYVGNALSVSWKILEGLSLSASATLYNLFGFRSYGVDDLSSVNARPGRSQTDRLITNITLSYKIVRQLTVGLEFTTDTIRPLGADGNDLVIFDTRRGPDNISSIAFSLTGSL